LGTGRGRIPVEMKIGPEEAATELALRWRAQFSVQPADHVIRCHRIGAVVVAIETLERALTFAAGRQRQGQEGPAFGASRSFGLSHDPAILFPLICYCLFRIEHL
jgi:hypothetical protein